MYLCDNKENHIISEAVYGARSKPNILYYKSTDAGKPYKDIKDYLCMFDISGMYVYIMRTNKFPYDKDRYATKIESEKYNEIISKKKYNELLKILPEFYIVSRDCQPDMYDIEPSLPRHDNKRLMWDCTRRTSYYTSIDIKILLRN